jgi:hypothetical protein
MADTSSPLFPKLRVLISLLLAPFGAAVLAVAPTISIVAYYLHRQHASPPLRAFVDYLRRARRT